MCSAQANCFPVHLTHYINKVGNYYWQGKRKRESKEQKTHFVRIAADKLPGKLSTINPKEI